MDYFASSNAVLLLDSILMPPASVLFLAAPFILLDAVARPYPPPLVPAPVLWSSPETPGCNNGPSGPWSMPCAPKVFGLSMRGRMVAFRSVSTVVGSVGAHWSWLPK